MVRVTRRTEVRVPRVPRWFTVTAELTDTVRDLCEKMADKIAGHYGDVEWNHIPNAPLDETLENAGVKLESENPIVVCRTPSSLRARFQNG